MKALVKAKAEPGIWLDEIPLPEIGINDVLIRILKTGICGTDWSIYTGKYSADKLPMIAGHEFSGTVARLGKNAKGLKEGDRVTGLFLQATGRPPRRLYVDNLQLARPLSLKPRAESK